MEKIIKAELADIEAKENVRIVYACESGSRAWGFPSLDSDYDVRFIYLHPLEWYLSIEKRRDVIERPIDRQLDVNGWDLRKTLQLFRKSNPPLFEWLNSPIVYLQKYSVSDRLRSMFPLFYSLTASAYHYLQMAHGNYKDYLKGEEVWIKKYFYVLRPLLAATWIERGLGVVPTEFEVLVDTLITSPQLKSEINRLIEVKRKGEELGKGPRIPIISEFIETEILRYDDHQFNFPKPKAPTAELDQLFIESLQEVWAS